MAVPERSEDSAELPNSDFPLLLQGRLPKQPKITYAALLKVLLAKPRDFFQQAKEISTLDWDFRGSKMKIDNISNMSRQEKMKLLLNYAKECYKNGNKPTKRSVRKKFHLEIYNYFRNISDYHKKAGIPVALRYYPREEARRVIINYVKKEAHANHFPEFREIERRFKIHFTSYFENLSELYKCANIELSLVKRARELSRFDSKDIVASQKRKIKELIQESVTNGFYPGVQYIQKKLNLSFYNLYEDIYQAYKNTRVEYDRPSPILLGKKKERILTKIIKELVLKMGFKIKRISLESETDFNRNSDMTIEDKNNRPFLVEIKAYRKDYAITHREFSQLVTYLKREHIDRGIFITTSNTKNCDFPQLTFINGNKLRELLKQYGLSYYLRLIKWIQEARVNSKERKSYLEFRKKEVMEYIKLRSYVPTIGELQKTLKIDIRSLYGEYKPYEKLLKDAKRLCALTPTA